MVKFLHFQSTLGQRCRAKRRPRHLLRHLLQHRLQLRLPTAAYGLRRRLVGAHRPWAGENPPGGGDGAQNREKNMGKPGKNRGQIHVFVWFCEWLSRWCSFKLMFVVDLNPALKSRFMAPLQAAKSTIMNQPAKSWQSWLGPSWAKTYLKFPDQIFVIPSGSSPIASHGRGWSTRPPKAEMRGFRTPRSQPHLVDTAVGDPCVDSLQKIPNMPRLLSI